MIRRFQRPFFLLTAMVCFWGTATANSWLEPKPLIEWKFKLGAVSVALEKCPFKKGKRHTEAVTNSETVEPAKKMRTYQEGRDFMLILDGPNKSQLCGVAYQFFGPMGTDLTDLLAPDPDQTTQKPKQ